jgi:DNA-directed RNA polymerase specialized sigma24 family protein
MGSIQDAEDTTMDIFDSLSDLFKKWEITNFKSWLGTLTKNYCLMKLRNSKKNATENPQEHLIVTDEIKTTEFENSFYEHREIVFRHLEEAIGRLDECKNAA